MTQLAPSDALCFVPLSKSSACIIPQHALKGTNSNYSEKKKDAVQPRGLELFSLNSGLNGKF